jgi:hypothetical protein
VRAERGHRAHHPETGATAINSSDVVPMIEDYVTAAAAAATRDEKGSDQVFWSEPHRSG